MLNELSVGQHRLEPFEKTPCFSRKHMVWMNTFLRLGAAVHLARPLVHLKVMRKTLLPKRPKACPTLRTLFVSSQQQCLRPYDDRSNDPPF